MIPVSVVPLDLPYLDCLESGCLVMTINPEDRPPWGAAGWVDWRLNGAISEHIAQKFLTGKEGESVMLSSEGRLPVSAIIVLSNAQADLKDEDAVCSYVQYMISVAEKAGYRRIAFAPPPPVSRERREVFFNGICRAMLTVKGDRRFEVLLPETLSTRFSDFLSRKTSEFVVGAVSLPESRLSSPNEP